MYLVGFKNRFTTMVHWAVSFVFRGRSQRTTTRQQIVARTLMARLSTVEEELNQVRAGEGDAVGQTGVGATDGDTAALTAEAAGAEPPQA
jgi:NADH:quinone reductase (non-electrogenic)